LLEGGDARPSTARRGRLVLANGHALLPRLEDLDRVALGERDDRSLLVGPLALREPPPLDLATAVERVDREDADVPDLLNGLLGALESPLGPGALRGDRVAPALQDVERGLREQDPVGREDVVGPERARVRDLDEGDVPEGLLDGALGRAGKNHENPADGAERLQQLGGAPGLRLVERELVDHHELSRPQRVGERRAKRPALHLLVDPQLVAARTRAVHDPAAGPLRSPDRALSSASGALLSPGLPPTAGNLAAGLRGVGARPKGG